MPATRLGAPPAKWVRVKEFCKKYDLGKTKAYEEIKKPGFPKMYIGDGGVRVNINATDKWFEENYN
jgi:predicted DNA-binding transcriptional regulator AlpA